MTYEKKYRIARAGLDHLERAFVEMSKAHEQMRDAYNIETNILNGMVDKLSKRTDELYEQNKEFEYRYEIAKEKMLRFEEMYDEERSKTWWQKLKETIKSKYQ